MGQVSVGTSAVSVANRNAARRTISFTNRSTSGQIIHLTRGQSGGLTVSNSDYVLSVGESLHFVLAFDGPDIKDEWSAVSDGASGVLHVGETSERPGVE